ARVGAHQQCGGAALSAAADGRTHSTIMRSAHTTRLTKTAGVPYFAFQVFKSVSETPRAREQAPQEKTGMCLARTFSRVSLNGGQPMGWIVSTVALRIM